MNSVDRSESRGNGAVYASPNDLAAFVYRALNSPNAVSPPGLQRLVNAAFSASLQTAEGGKVSFDIVLRADRDKWQNAIHRGQLLPFHVPRRLDSDTLVQLAQGLQIDQVGVAVECNDGAVDLIGLTPVAQALGGDSQFLARLGAVRLTVAAPGHLIVLTDESVVAELRDGGFLVKQSPVLFRGAVRDRLRHGAEHLVATVLSRIKKRRRHPAPDILFSTVERARLLALFNLLRSIRSLRRGGSIIVVPAPPKPNVLNVRFSPFYSGIPEALKDLTLASLPYITPPRFGGRDSNSERGAVRLARQRLDDAIRFVAQISRVDGITIVDEQFALTGFGAMAVSTDIAVPVHTAADSEGRVLSGFDTSSRGARHRSVLATCVRIPGGVGFIISQDGAVRTVLARGADLVLWDQFSED